MDWSETIRKAVLLAQPKGYITFHQLDEILPQTLQFLPPTIQTKEIENLLNALSEEGIRVEEE
jgi:hypothetical protein